MNEQTGESTRAFGFTADGGSSDGGQGELVTESNVPITPGQTYSFEIPDGGYVEIRYIQ